MFRLAAGEKRTLQVRLVTGDSFAADDLRAADDRWIEICLLADETELGGVRYTVDPDLER